MTKTTAVVLCVAHAVLLWCCYFPLGFHFLAWIAFVPYLGLVRWRTATWRACAFGWLSGWLFFAAVLQWMHTLSWNLYLTWFALSVYCSCYYLAATWILRFVDRNTRLPLVLAFPALWVALEYLRSILLTGFAWYYLSHTQHDVLPVIQIADLTGSYGVSFLIAAVNALVFEGMCQWRIMRERLRARCAYSSRRAFVVQCVGVVALIAATWWYGMQRLEEQTTEQGPLLGLLQGNINQTERNAAMLSKKTAAKVLEHFLQMHEVAARQGAELIVWPETSYPDIWLTEEGRGTKPLMRAWAREIWQRGPAPVLLGIPSTHRGPYGTARRYNSAILLGTDGEEQGQYHKIHLVPFGEYIPLEGVVPLMRRLSPYDGQYVLSPGSERVVLGVGPYRFGILICFEDSDAVLACSYVADTEPVDFFINMSNDGWFNGTCEHDEHLAVCRFRAIECRRAVARAVNLGISALIDGNGRVLAPTERGVEEDLHVWAVGSEDAELQTSAWGNYKVVRGVLLARVPIDRRQSVYARHGDWLPVLCLSVIALALLAGWLIPRWRDQAPPTKMPPLKPG